MPNKIDIEVFKEILKKKREEFDSPCSSTIAAIELAKKIREYEEKTWNDPNATVKSRYPPRGLFS